MTLGAGSQDMPAGIVEKIDARLKELTPPVMSSDEDGQARPRLTHGRAAVNLLTHPPHLSLLLSSPLPRGGATKSADTIYPLNTEAPGNWCSVQLSESRVGLDRHFRRRSWPGPSAGTW